MNGKVYGTLSALVLAVPLIVSGCGKDAKDAQGADGGKKTELNVTIVTESQGDTVEQQSWEELAKAYMAKRSDVKINMTVQNMGGVEQHRTWVTTQLIGSTAPDVFTTRRIWDQEDLKKGLLLDLTPYFQEASSYAGGKSLEKTLSPAVLAQLIGEDKKYASVPTFVDVVRVMYNKSLFEKAGITQVPKTWNEFLSAQAKLKQANVTPFSFPNSKPGDYNYSWSTRILTEELIASSYDQLDVNKNGFIEVNEYVRGVDQGIIDIEKAPYKDVFPLLKDWSQYWAKGYNGLDFDTSTDQFVRGDAAMIMRTSAQSKVLFESQARKFEMGMFPLPYLTKENNPAAIGKLMEIGGVPAGNLAIPKSIAADKQAAAVDFLKFVVSSDMQALMAEKLYRAPVSQDVNLPEKLSGFKFAGDQMKLNIYGGELDKTVTEFNQKLGQTYLEGKMTAEQYISGLKKTMIDGIKKKMEENKWSKENNYGIQ